MFQKHLKGLSKASKRVIKGLMEASGKPFNSFVKPLEGLLEAFFKGIYKHLKGFQNAFQRPFKDLCEDFTFRIP